MSDNLKPVRPRIVIDETHGPGGTPLQQCFFMETDLEGAYNIYDSEARLLAAYVVSGEDFNLTVNSVHFFISKFSIDDRAANGSWSIGHHRHPRAVEDVEQEGTFQASSGPGVPTESDNEGVSADAPAGAIVINVVKGDPDKDKLKGCYFLPSGINNTYNLYSKKGTWLASGLVTRHDFTFPHDSAGPNEKITWTVTNFVISDTAASGNWSNPDNPAGDQGGTFQASSGPGVEEKEAASAASAS